MAKTMPGIPLLLAQSHLQKGGETFGSTLAQFPQQLTIVEEKLTKDLGNTEDVLPMGNGIEHRLFQMMGKLDHLFVMA
jgi:hypothetical protein